MDKNLKQISRSDSSQVMDGLKRQTQLGINCVQVGTIVAFDATTQLASVQVAMKQIRDVYADGTKVVQEYPVVMECPVVTLFGGVDFLSMPIQEGDSCLLLFNDREIDQWLYNGTGGAPVTNRLHDLTDCIAIVGIRPLTNSIGSFLANGIRLSHGGGDTQVDLKDGILESIATMFLHHGDLQVTGNAEVKGNALVDGGLTVLGHTYGNAGTLTIDANATLTGSHTLTAPIVNSGNGATGTYNVVTVLNGIVTGGS